MFQAGALAAWLYGCTVLTYGRGLFLPLLVTGAVLIVVVGRRGRGGRLFDVGLALLAVTATLLALDTAGTAVRNRQRAAAARQTDAGSRDGDRHVWHGELMPRQYYPGRSSVSLYKPGSRLSAPTYGEFYTASMLASPLLRDSVLELWPRSYFIGPHGLRDTTSIASARVFTLGDSFAMGFATAEGLTWSDLLGAARGEHVYNLGVSATGPALQLALLEHLYEVLPDSLRIRRLLWMIFEGNDLENSYALGRTGGRPSGPALLEGTPLDALLSLPSRVQRASLLRQVARGEWRRRSAGPAGAGRHEVDGVALPMPLFRSERFGYRFFSAADLENATRPLDYVLRHPNRPRLDSTFAAMQSLSRAKGFEVTVILAPSDARLYGAAFEGFPALSAEPHFLRYVARLSDSLGFGVVDLLPLLRPHADTALLYYRDDHHWNRQGNVLVARLLDSALAR